MNQAIVDKFTEYVASLPKDEGRAVTHQVIGAHLENHAGTIFAQSADTELERVSRLGDVVIDTLQRSSADVSFGFCTGMGVTLTTMAVDLFSDPEVFPQDAPVVLRNLPKLKSALALLGGMSDGQSTVNDILEAARI